MRLSHNEITTMPNILPDISTTNLQLLDLSFNALQGQLSDIRPTASLTQLFLNNNPNLKTMDGTLPAWLQPSTTYTKLNVNQSYECPQLQAGQLQISLDPTYYSHSLCRKHPTQIPHARVLPPSLTLFASNVVTLCDGGCVTSQSVREGVTARRRHVRSSHVPSAWTQ